MRQSILILTALALWASSFAQQPAAPPAKKTAQKKTEAAAQPRGLTVDGIVSMVQAGLSEDLIVARIRKEDRAFDLTPEEMVKLKKEGVSDTIMQVMLDSRAEIKRAVAPPPPAEAPQPSGITPPTAPAKKPAETASPVAPDRSPPVLAAEPPPPSAPATSSQPFQPTVRVPVNLQLTKEITSATAEAGDQVTFTIADDVLYNEAVLLKKGTTGLGSVRTVKRKSRLSSGKIEFDERVAVEDAFGRQLIVKLVQTDSDRLITAGAKAVVGATTSVFKSKQDAVLPQGTVFEGLAAGQAEAREARAAPPSAPGPASAPPSSRAGAAGSGRSAIQRRVFITAKGYEVGETAIPDKSLLDSVSDLKGAASSRGFTVVENEAEARLMLVVLERQFEQVRPTIMRHRTQRVEGVLNCTLLYKDGDGAEWKPAIKLRAQSLYWKDVASKMMGEVDKWLK